MTSGTSVILIGAPEGQSLPGIVEAIHKAKRLYPDSLGREDSAEIDEHGRAVLTYSSRGMAERARAAWEHVGYTVFF